MCLEDVFSDESLELMFQNMSEDEIKEFWKELEGTAHLRDMLNKGYSFGGGAFSKSVFVYKDLNETIKKL